MRIITALLLMAWLIGITILISSLGYPNDLATWANGNLQTRLALDPAAYLPYGYAITGCIPLLLAGLIFRSTGARRRLLQHIAQLKAEHDLTTLQLAAHLPAIEHHVGALEAQLTQGTVAEAESHLRDRLEKVRERQRALLNRMGQLNQGANSLASIFAAVNETKGSIASTLDAIDQDGDGLAAKVKALEAAAASQPDRLTALEALPPRLQEIKAALTAHKERAGAIDANNELTHLYNEVDDMNDAVEKQVADIEAVDDDGDLHHHVSNLAASADALAKRLDALAPLPRQLAELKKRLAASKEIADVLDGKDGIGANITTIKEQKEELEEQLEKIEKDDDGDDIADVVENLEEELGALDQRFQNLAKTRERLTEILNTAAGNAKTIST